MPDKVIEAETANIPETPEAGFRNVRVLYHGGRFSEKQQLFPKYGLLGKADHPTLTSAHGILWSFAREYLTMWYPLRSDVGPRNRDGLQTIQNPLPNKDKIQILEDIDALEITEKEKSAFHDMDRQLPADRLGVVLSSHNTDAFPSNQFSEGLREFGNFVEGQGLYWFAKDPDKLLEKARNLLEHADVVYIADGLTKDQVVYDMVSNAVEDKLLGVGLALKRAIDSQSTEDLDYWKEHTAFGLENMTFSNPVYERYRQSLLRKYNKSSGVSKT